MTFIKDLSERISEEIADAEYYAKHALSVKDEYPTAAQTFYTIAGQELTHASMLHDLATRAIADYRAKHGEPPAAMEAVYKYLHEQQIEHTEAVKRYLDMYKE